MIKATELTLKPGLQTLAEYSSASILSNVDIAGKYAKKRPCCQCVIPRISPALPPPRASSCPHNSARRPIPPCSLRHTLDDSLLSATIKPAKLLARLTRQDLVLEVFRDDTEVLALFWRMVYRKPKLAEAKQH